VRHPGLDVDVLAAYRPARADLGRLRLRVAEHLEAHDGYLAFSGGKDSTVVVALARQVDPAVPIAFFDSGLEYPETYDYIDALATQWRLNLTWIPARPNALTLMAASGGWTHNGPYRLDLPNAHEVLIAAPARAAHALHGPGELWGVRAEESEGRSFLYARSLRREVAAKCRDCCSPVTTSPRAEHRARHGGIVRRADGTVAFGPIWDWKDDEVWGFLRSQQIPVNPVYAKLTRLGVPRNRQRVALMVDGNGLELGRVVWLRRGWPAVYQRLVQVLPRLAEWI